MLSKHAVDQALVTAAQNADDTVGVTPLHWYIAIVNNRSEKSCSDKLAALGYESYVPVQTVVRTRKGGKKVYVNHVVLSALVFVRTSEKDRKTHVAALPFIKRFMTDPAKRGNPSMASPVAIIPDHQMQSFRFMIEHAETPVQIDGVIFHPGERVKVVRGHLAGMEGTVRLTAEGKSRLCISLDILGCASVEIDKSYLELIK